MCTCVVKASKLGKYIYTRWLGFFYNITFMLIIIAEKSGQKKLDSFNLTATSSSVQLVS